MFKKIIYAAIAIVVVVAGYIGVNRLNYWQRSVRIFSLDSSQPFKGHGGRGFESRKEGRQSFEGREGFQRPAIRQLPDGARARFEAQGGRPPRGEFEEGLRGGDSGGLPGGKKVNLISVWWFLAVFAAFTAITIYADKAYNLIKKRAIRQ